MRGLAAEGTEGRTLMNVGQDTTLRDRDMTQQLVQFLVISDGKLEMTGNDSGLLVITGGIASQLEDFGSEVLENGGEVDGSTLRARQWRAQRGRRTQKN